MKRIALGTFAALFATHAYAADPFLVGVIAPTTGPLATIGSRTLSVMQWWEKAVNAKGGIKGRPVELLHCNDEANPEKSVTCVRTFLSRGVVVIANYSVTGPVRAVTPLLQNGPVMLTPSPNIIPSPATFVFQTSPSDLDQCKAIAAFMTANKLDKLAMIATTDSTGEVAVANARKVFPEAGIDLKLARIDLRANDASIQLANIVRDGAKLIYSNYTGAGAVTVVKSYVNLGLDQPMIVNSGNVSAAFISVIKNDMPRRLMAPAVKGLVPESLSDPAEVKHLAEFTKSYQSWRGEPIDQLALNGLGVTDITTAILQNVENPKDAETVRTYLRSGPIPSYRAFRFTAENNVGLGADDVAVVEYKNGRWVPTDRM